MFQPAPLFGEGCVLPMDREIRIFGQADDGAQVLAQLTDSEGKELGSGASQASGGRFLCLLPAMKEPAVGCTLRITCEGECAQSTGVSIGLVFLAGGQSNMELALWNADEGQALIRTHEDGELRYFNVPQKALWNEAAEEAERSARWKAICPGVGGDMSAVAYFFAARVRRALKVPVGVIGCYWGGTSVTAWMDEECLLRTAEGTRYLNDYRKASEGKTLEKWQEEEDAFQHDMQVWNGKVAELREQEPGIVWEEIERRAGKCPWNPPVGPGSPYRPGGIAETMLKRVTPAALSAMLYYQGEEDTFRTRCYDLLLCSMAVRWRELFDNMRLPFINMQLPMFIEKGREENWEWPELRLAQQKAADILSDSRLTCIIDCGEFNNIHPTDKRTPGERMADEYLAMIGSEEAQRRLCPCAVEKTVLPDRVLIRTDKPVRALEGCADLFEVAGADGSFAKAEARIIGGDVIELRSTEIAQPVKARYAFVSYAKVHVFGDNGAPLRPFCM